jgi:hypothetical protein
VNCSNCGRSISLHTGSGYNIFTEGEGNIQLCAETPETIAQAAVSALAEMVKRMAKDSRSKSYVISDATLNEARALLARLSPETEPQS